MAHVWQFLHYIEDFMTGEKYYDHPTCKKKCEQLKRMLKDMECSTYIQR